MVPDGKDLGAVFVHQAEAVKMLHGPTQGVRMNDWVYVCCPFTVYKSRYQIW